MGELLRGRLLEAGDGGALRVHRGHHVPAGAVLAGGVDALQHDQERVLLLGVEPVLQLGQPRDLAWRAPPWPPSSSSRACRGRRGRSPSSRTLRAGLDHELLAEVHGVPPSRPRRCSGALTMAHAASCGGRHGDRAAARCRRGSPPSSTARRVVDPDPGDRRPRDLRHQHAEAAHQDRQRPGWRRSRRTSGSAGNGGRKNQPSVRATNSSRWPPATSCRNIMVCSARLVGQAEARRAAPGRRSTSRPISSRPNDWIDAEEAEQRRRSRAAAASSSGSASG